MELYEYTSSLGMSENEQEYLIWSETSFPFGGSHMIYRQICSYVRAKKNSIIRCKLCGWKEPYHRKNCLNSRVSE